jgi:hypothetical protein
MDRKAQIMNYKDISFVPYYVLQTLFHLVEPEVSVWSGESEQTFRGQLISRFFPKHRFNFIGLHSAISQKTEPLLFYIFSLVVLASITTLYKFYLIQPFSLITFSCHFVPPFLFISSFLLAPFSLETRAHRDDFAVSNEIDSRQRMIS